MSDTMKALADRLEAQVKTMGPLAMVGWDTLSADILEAARTLRAALTPPADDEIEAIRARHEADNGFESDGLDSAEWRASLTMLATRAHTDRATLLRALAAERARRVEVEWEVERLEEEGADFVRSQFLPELDEFSNLLLIDFLWVSSALLGNLDWLTEVTGEAPEDEDAIMVAEARKRYEHYRDLQANARAALASVTDEEVAVVKAERDRAQRACEQMGERITSLEAELVRLREALGTLTDCQPVPKVYKYTGTAEVDVENMFDVGHRHRNGKQPRDYLMSWLSMLRPFAYATKDDSWGELEKLISIVMNNYVQILVRAEKARAALNQEGGQ